MRLGMAKGYYPGFVTGDAVGEELPVFVYHRVRPARLRMHLEHLRRNGYATLNIQDILLKVEAGTPFSGKEVLLTFDDGLSDLAKTTAPLLGANGMKAVSFVAPFWIGREGMITWDQAVALNQNGCLDFQSHGLTHKRMPVSPEITGFVRPGMHWSRHWQVPMPEGISRDDARTAWGLPLFRSASRLSDLPQYLDPAGTSLRCVERVAKEGGRRFFLNPFWKRILFDLVRSAPPGPEAASYETGGEQASAIRRELEESRRMLEQRLPGAKVAAFSFPFNEGGKAAERTLRELTYRLVFTGIGPLPSRADGLFHFRRMGGDFIMRLPGQGRKSLRRIFLEKAAERIFYGQGY
jgi:peptidoglycan/xylan/chitin deacetylase (PgdA/CDA1 family)